MRGMCERRLSPRRREWSGCFGRGGRRPGDRSQAILRAGVVPVWISRDGRGDVVLSGRSLFVGDRSGFHRSGPVRSCEPEARLTQISLPGRAYLSRRPGRHCIRRAGRTQWAGGDRFVGSSPPPGEVRRFDRGLGALEDRGFRSISTAVGTRSTGGQDALLLYELSQSWQLSLLSRPGGRWVSGGRRSSEPARRARLGTLDSPCRCPPIPQNPRIASSLEV